LITQRHIAGLAIVATVAIALTGCAGTASAETTGITKAKASVATSAADFGGMEALVAAANAEGQLNVITLPPSWANYGKILALFQKTYPKIKINSANPNGSSANEVSAAEAQKGQSTAPDVFDIGTAVLDQNLDLVAPYKVSNWADIPTDFKDASGKWYYDYTGLMSIGYDSSKVKTAPTTYADLLKDNVKVAIKGDPTQANEAASAVYLAALQNKGTADNIQPGIDFFTKLQAAGDFNNVLPTQATVNSGETPVVLQWSYNNLAWGPAAGAGVGNSNWKVVIPTASAALGSYYNQAINADAPDPAAARLWEEFIYSPAVQNLYLASGAYPATLAAMEKNKTVDADTLKTVGAPPANFVQLTADQATAAATLLGSKWAAAIK
jgi:putative spermidine/putrescine transport system substrate-binding protein